jgi:hypothetical protein
MARVNGLPLRAGPIDPSANTVSPIRKNRLRPIGQRASDQQQAGENHGV